VDNSLPKPSTLTVSDAKIIDAVWPASCSGSREMIEASIEWVGSGGVYVGKDADGNDTTEKAVDSELVSWAVALPFGSIHALHTVEDYQRRGFGALSMRVVSKAVASKGRIPAVQIFKSNDSSKSVNLSVGYKLSHEIDLIHYFPHQNDIQESLHQC
jgi:hypothetical protein